jgi:hypothetical protein
VMIQNAGRFAVEQEIVVHKGFHCVYRPFSYF